MEQVRIRDVALSASRIGLGTWAMGGVQWGGADDDESVRTIHAALDHGISLIDTAPAYGFGHSESVVGRAIAERGARDKVILATKGGLERRGEGLFRNSSPAQLFAEVEGSLRRLRTDYIDLYQIHWPDPDTSYEDTARALLELQREGKIRAIGVSNYSIDGMERFQSVAPIAIAQPPLNLFERDSERTILPYCRTRGIGTLTYGALCRGLLTGTIDRATQFKGDDLRKTDPKFQPPRVEHYLRAVDLLRRYARDRYQKGLIAFALRWVLDRAGVSCALWGARHPDELSPVDEVMGWHLDEEAHLHIDEILAETIHEPTGSEFMAPPEHVPQSLEDVAGHPI